ncbi:hypothetical protein [Saccharothrix texasensis]|uniref:Uncharacterized protein n=1 Tax=Saccharothrix texasensis TaxID=103734 RepID=A0A3N1HEB2_9PSEU|nr:hypothetical protein [Saccharothrix texasensis]ROP40813.1 hypothetical protein EDD40_6231 [Saccharothrix texasensis]
MSRWVWPAAAGVVTSATGVAINLATDGGANPWAWVTVVLLTALGVVIALRVQASAPKPPTPEPPTSAPPESTVRNSITGSVTGPVVQAGDIGGGLTVNSPTTVNQTAVARDGGTVHQAGRDIRHD